MQRCLDVLLVVAAIVFAGPAAAATANADALYRAALAQQGKNPAAYVAQLTQAANAGSTAAMNRLGLVHERGAAGKTRDPAQAAAWFGKSADAGSAFGTWLLARVRADALSLSTSPDAARAEVAPLLQQAFERARKGAESGQVDGLLTLGLSHSYGTGTPRDILVGEGWLAKAVARGDDEAQIELGELYASDALASSPRLPYKPQAGLELMKKSAAAGNTQAMRLLADLLRLGRHGAWTSADGTSRFMIDPDDPKTSDSLKPQIPGVARNLEQAVSWYRKAIAGGDGAALQNLATLYVSGTGVPKDYGEAMRLMRAGADRGIDVSMLTLGAMYRDGLGVEKNDATAAEWFRKAAGLGNRRAKDALAKLEAAANAAAPTNADVPTKAEPAVEEARK